MDWAPYYIGAYLAGSIPFGWLVARAKGVNIREVGSGNIGATNVGRALGRNYAILVFLLDFLKGLIPTWLAASQTGGSLPWEVIVVALLSITGHVFPIWLNFRGGKGVATAAGALTALLPIPVLAAVAVWIILFYSTRYVSVASLCAAVMLPFAAWLFDADTSGIALATSIMLLAFFTHRSNIAALLQGRENRFTKSDKS